MSKMFKIIISNTSASKRVMYKGIVFEPRNSRIFAVSRSEKKELLQALKLFPTLNVESKIITGKETDIIDLNVFMEKVSKPQNPIEKVEDIPAEVIKEEDFVEQVEGIEPEVTEEKFTKKNKKKSKKHKDTIIIDKSD